MKAGDRKVYVIDGDVVQYADKSGIDVAKSDKSIVVCDAETGKYEYTSPDQLMNVGEPADPSTLSEAYMANERAKEAAANGEGTAEGNAAAESNAAANGDVSSDGGKAEVVEPAYTDGSRVEINGHEYDVKSAGEKTVVLVDEHGKELAWTRSALDAKLESGDAEVLEPKAEAAPDVATEGLKAGDVFEDSDGNALTVKRVDGDKVVAVGADGKAQTYEDGTFEQMVESGVLKRETTDLNAAQTGSPEGDGVPAFGVGSVIELEGHEYKLLRVDKEDDTVYLENVEGETELWSYSGICIAFNEGDARLIDNKNYVLTDNQGNPVNEDGTLKVEEVKSVDELTDEDFSAPTRNVQLPALPQNVDAALNANGKPVIIKKNIFKKNWGAHGFYSDESRAILKAALYNTDLVGQRQSNDKPLHWVAIRIDDESPTVVLEVNENKDNIEIVDWFTVDERESNRIYRIKKQAEKNGGELVMLSPKDKVESLSTPQTDLSSESKGTEQSSSVQVDVSENAPMPMRVVGKGKNAVQEEDWLATTPKRGHDYVFKESGLDAEEANAFVENKVAEAEKNLEKVKGKAPKMGTNIAAYKEAKADYEARVAEAQKAVDYWHAVKAERDKVLLEERRARKEKDKALYDDAVAQEEQRKAEMAQKAAEQEALGSNAVAPAIKEKWENAPKVDGGADEITLPNGEVVTGHYVLTESGAASASHQATNGFAETEGYPVDVNGETVNDRDYKRDAEAQQVTRGMAADYDSRALQSPVVVSGDGVVLSGNGRTMAGEIAALNGSDAKYNAYLRGHVGKFGFTAEQVEGFKHPRVVFVPDGEMPYTSETFAKFNQREQKSQSRTEMAVKLGKVVDDALFGRVMDVIGRHESLAEFYADDAATAAVVKELADAGVIPQTEMAQLFDGGRLSESGQAMVEGVLVGKVFQGSPDAVRQITEVKSMRKAVMAALPEVVACHRLGGGYDLSKELAAAVDLVYKARKAGFKLGQHVSQHARQGNLFQLDDGATVADYNNAAVMMLADVMNDGRVTQLKKVLSFYNTQAADSAQGIGDMFAGGVKSKGQIINEVNELLNNGQEYDRRTPSVADGQGVGGEGGEQGDVAGPSHQGGEGSERGLSEAFDGLAAQLKTADGEERKRVLGEMRDGIARFAEENGYPVPEFLLTREDFLAAVPEKDRAKYVEMLEKGMRMPAYYENKKVYYFVEGCDNFDKDVAETLAHEYTHADNAEFSENVDAIVYAVEDTHEVSQDELVDILEKLSDSTAYEEKAEQLEAEGKNANPMLADEVIAHSVGRMVVEGEQALDGITKNPTLQFFIKRAYKERENERQHNLYSNRNAERADKTVPSSGRNSSDNEAVAGGTPGDGQIGGSSEGDGHLEGTAERGRSTVSEGKEVAAPSEEGAKVGVTDGEKSSATGDVMPSGKGNTPLSEKIATASAEVNTEPTEAQKEAGNYKKGHVQVGTFDITIEQPQGSVRKGTDADGKQWESKMNNTYGYIRGAVGVDGDHIDVFLSNDIDSWNGRRVFVVDQYNPDGSFDEHKVMLGFNDADEAKSDYLANYENGWENGRRIDVTAVNLEDFEKWIASSKRKTKPFGEYSSVKNGVVPSGKGKTDNSRQQKAVGKSAQPPTREESILRDVVIEHMKGSGLDVIGTEDGQRVLDMANDDGAKEHRVYHGSGAEFDHFDHSHMGEGEGAQAYGWGTYVTEVRGIGEGYAIRSKNGISMSREEWSLKRSELESNIYRAKEQLPFLKGEYKAEVEAQISEWEEQLKDYEPHNYLYTVEIPDDNGGNYLDWNGPVPAETIDRITEYLREKYGDEVVNGRWLSNPLLSNKGVDVSARNGAAIYRQLERTLGSDKKASLALAELGYAGIKYPAEFRSGGRKDGAQNYVIFNENDAEITDHVRFFKTKNGEAYGFTVGGKIYYDPRIANAETPVHEYAHLWAEALRNGNAEEWKNVVELMKGTPVWNEVKARYTELKSDDEIADEVIATYSGRRGAERLREEQRKIADGDGSVSEKAAAISALERVKQALKKFWKAVADFLHIHYKSAEEVADRVMKDLLDGVDPRKFMGNNEKGFRFSAKQKRALETASLGNAPRSLTVVSSATGAKVLNSIDKLVDSLEKSATQPKTFIGNVAKALGASRFGSGSEYATFETKNGDVVTIRLANHNAHVSGFDHNGKDNGISIVISPKPNEGITNDGNAHITEFYYDSIKLRRADGKPLADIVRSIKQALYSGEFKDTTGLAERQEVNGDDVIRFQLIGENDAATAEGLKDVVEKMKADVERLHEGELDDLRSGARAIGGRLSELNKAMRLQRAYDMSTVASVTELAKTMLKNGLLSEMSDYDVRRLLSVVNNVHGKGDIRPYVQKVVDMMVGNRLRNVSKAFDKLLAMRGKKVDARGVEVQGELDLAGQRMADVVWKGIGMSDDDVADMCADAQDRMMSANGAEAAAATDYAGWQIVMRYNETIRDSKSEEVRLREDLKRAKEDYDAGRMTREAYMEFRESTNDAIRENRIERAEAYEELYEQLGGAYGESIKRAADFKAAEKARVLEIQHNANSDMEGRPARSYRKDTAVDKVLNSSPVQLLFAPLGTFDQMLRMFGSKNVKGEGYLWNRYMRGWLTATENEYTGYRDATAELDAKAAEVLGKGKTWADLFALERKLPKATVRVWDNGEMRELELPQGNLLYIYMVDKMADGRMKLRKMGVTEDDVAAIEDFLDPRLKEIGDWLQEVYLVEKRGKYNEVHERMFGAAMASIDNYFPLKILKDARAENVDVGVEKRESEMASTITGSVVKRTRNALALDLLNSDAFSVVLDHLQQMEHWSAFAEWNRDLNTLLSYKHFRNQVKNMRSAYGSGERLWEAFDKVARIAAGTYTPPKAFADKLAVNIAKGVTAAKISLRVFTALKQFTSFPAYLSDSNPVYLLKGVANPYGSWKWCMENLPLFEKRWKSRMAGDPRLLKNEMDWGLWRDNVVQMAAKWGMTPNGFVDALTVCIGARAMYETRRRKYIRYGYGLEEAERRAKQDASILYNQTQQSSEGAFLSALQVDRSWYSVLFTVFRNSSMSYTRQLYAALRNTGRRIAGGAKFKGISEAFMAKQMERDGIDPEKASKNAKAEYRKSWINDLVRAGVFGYVLQLAWNCGPYALYMLFGDDEKKGKEMWHDIWTHTAFGSVEGLTGGDVWSAGLQSL